MRKLFLSIIALTLGIGAWAQETQSVNYIDADGQQKTVTATVVTNETTTLNAGWYIVFCNDVQTGPLTCNGAVHIILADGAKLTATGGEEQAGITVSNGNTLAIYGQTAQSGQLIANGGNNSAGIGGGNHGSGTNITINGGTVTARGGNDGAGIGGGFNGSGSNITINGGTVTATGGNGGAGIGGGFKNFGSIITINDGNITVSGGSGGAGIGGGNRGFGSNITICGGTVTANGGDNGAGIGGGRYGSSSNIRVSADCHVLADGNNPPTSEIVHGSDEDIASKLNQRYAFIEVDQTILSELRAEAIAAIDEAIEGEVNADILDIAQEAKNLIMDANDRMTITGIKDAALDELKKLIKIYHSVLGPLGEEHPGPAVKVTKGDTEVILYLPDKVEYIIRK